MNLTCAEFEILLADQIDGALPPESAAAFRAHRESCALCAALAADAASVVAFMDRAAAVEPPPELVGRILRATGARPQPRKPDLWGWINRMFSPVLSPRLVMGTMLTLISLAMLTRGLDTTKTLTAADLDPVRIWTALDGRTHRVWDRAVMRYESTPVVFEVRNQIDDWAEQRQEADEAGR